MITLTEGQKLTFRTLNGQSVSGTVTDPTATVGALSAIAATRLGIAGPAEAINPANAEVLTPETPLSELPDADNAELVLAPSLTPAAHQ